MARTKIDKTQIHITKFTSNDPHTLEASTTINSAFPQKRLGGPRKPPSSVRVNRRLSTADVIVFGARQRGHCARAAVKSHARVATSVMCINFWFCVLFSRVCVLSWASLFWRCGVALDPNGPPAAIRMRNSVVWMNVLSVVGSN